MNAISWKIINSCKSFRGNLGFKDRWFISFQRKMERSHHFKGEKRVKYILKIKFITIVSSLCGKIFNGISVKFIKKTSYTKFI